VHISGSSGRGINEDGLKPTKDRSFQTNIQVSAQPMQYSCPSSDVGGLVGLQGVSGGKSRLGGGGEEIPESAGSGSNHGLNGEGGGRGGLWGGIAPVHEQVEGILLHRIVVIVQVQSEARQLGVTKHPHNCLLARTCDLAVQRTGSCKRMRRRRLYCCG